MSQKENAAAESVSSSAASKKTITSLKDLSSEQKKSGLAAWLGWLFDGLDMHLYGLVAAPFVASLLANKGLIPVADAADQMVKDKSGIIQAAFLIGWALGGGFFGRVGDLIGRSRALSLTILTYAAFTGLSFFATSWEQLMVFRFLAALGIGGEWAVGSALLSETWPKHWRPWIAAVLQTGVNFGVLLACFTTYVMASTQPKYVFLVGIIPALLVFWIRRHVPEPEEWHNAQKEAGTNKPGIIDLFRGKVLRTTILTIVVCACGLTAWWAFMFWHTQHLRNLPDLAEAKQALYAQQLASGAFGANPPDPAKWVSSEEQKVVSTAFFLVITSSILGNFFAAWLAKLFGYRRAIALTYFGFFVAMFSTFIQPRGWEALVWFWFPFVGFFSGVFGLFTMYLPPLFPTLLRTTGAGFCYNIGRIISALGVVYSGSLASHGDFKKTLIFASFLFVPAVFVSFMLPEPKDLSGPVDAPVD